ncbi:MAG: c-type cytochrome [Deltaproteobacteria bacterium]|nr:c-type cytochrome [Deltaproteobacteria bacterium]
MKTRIGVSTRGRLRWSLCAGLLASLPGLWSVAWAQQPAAAPPKLSEPEFNKAKQIYFDRCAGCHGTLRAGATGPAVSDKRAQELGNEGLEIILTKGTPGGMPAWGKSGILSADEIKLLANYLQLPPPEPPQRGLKDIKESWKLFVPVDKRPKSVQTKRNWENYFGVIMRDAGKVAIVDGDKKEQVAVIDTGFAVHILRSSSTGRYFYAIGRDGRVSMIDLWPDKPTLVAQVQGCYDARSVEASKYKGFEDKLVIEGCYWPPQYVVLDGQTLEPKTVVDVLTPTYDTKEALKEVRVASIIPAHDGPYWIVSLKESGYVAIVDYSKPGFPMTSKIATERFLHDGGWDKTKRYFMVAANMRNSIVVVDAKEKKLVTKFETGIKPHPGRGANWEDPEFGSVNGTVHIGEGRLVVYGADPAGKPEHAWKVVRNLKLPATGGLFLKTHPKSQWVWMDSPLSNDSKAIANVCVYSKKDGSIEKCFQTANQGRAVHFEYNKDGNEVWVSSWDKNGELVVYDDASLEEKARITGDWVVTPTGKFNVFNTAHDVY